jgi:RNA-directed DNA polymerase
LAKSLATPIKIRELQIKLYQKAKKEPEFRFYQLYDKVYRQDILEHAYGLAKANAGSPGPDGESFADIEWKGREEWLNGLRKELHDQTYRAQPVRRKMIAKHGGGERPLGIPNIRDRVVQTAAKLILEPIWEADLEPNAYGYRPGRSAQEAVEKVQELLKAGYTDVVDADLSKYFDTIPHSELMQSVRRRIVDRQMLHLIKMWLTAPVEEKDGETGKKRLTGGKDKDHGTPQGGVVSPGLANLYMNRMLKGFRQRKREEEYRARIVNYADDFVILSHGKAEEALGWTQRATERMQVTLNPKKTSLKDARREQFDFLGYTFGPRWNPRTGQRYIGFGPSKKSVGKITEKVSELLDRGVVQPWEEVREKLNQKLRGWKQYFNRGSTSKAYRAVDAHVEERVRHFLRKRHKVSSQGTRQFSREQVYGARGVFRLQSPACADS